MVALDLQGALATPVAAEAPVILEAADLQERVVLREVPATPVAAVALVIPEVAEAPVIMAARDLQEAPVTTAVVAARGTTVLPVQAAAAALQATL